MFLGVFCVDVHLTLHTLKGRRHTRSSHKPNFGCICEFPQYTLQNAGTSKHYSFHSRIMQSHKSEFQIYFPQSRCRQALEQKLTPKNSVVVSSKLLIGAFTETESLASAPVTFVLAIGYYWQLENKAKSQIG